MFSSLTLDFLFIFIKYFPNKGTLRKCARLLCDPSETSVPSSRAVLTPRPTPCSLHLPMAVWRLRTPWGPTAGGLCVGLWPHGGTALALVVSLSQEIPAARRASWGGQDSVQPLFGSGCYQK